MTRTVIILAAIVSAIWIGTTTKRATAQPEGGGSDEIELDDAGPAGSGSGSGSATTPEPPKTIQKDPKAAKKAFAAGQASAAKGDAFVKRGKADEAKAAFEAAVASFDQATQLGDDVNVYWYMAAVEDKLGRYVDSVKHYRMVMRAQSGVQPAIAKQVQAKLDEEMGKIGTLQLTIAPDGAAILLAGEQIGTSPLPEPLVLLPGTYTFSFNAPGFQPKEAEIKIEAGSESERKIELESVAVIIEKPRKVLPDEPEEQPQPKKPSMIPVFAAGGASVVLLGTAIVTGMLASGQHDTFVDPKTSKRDRQDAAEVGKDYAHLTDVCLVGSLLSGGFAAYWYIFQVRPKLNAQAETPAAASKMTVVPWVQHDTSGLSVLGHF